MYACPLHPAGYQRSLVLSVCRSTYVCSGWIGINRGYHLLSRQVLPFQKRFLSVLVTGFFVLNLFVGTLSVFLLSQSQVLFEKQAAINTQNLSLTLERYISGDIDKIKFALVTVKNECEHGLPGQIDKKQIDAIIGPQLSMIPFVAGFRIADGQGNIIYGTALPQGATFTAAGRDYFIRHKSFPNVGLDISKPILGRIVGKPIVVFSMRLDNPDGSFAGVVFANISMDYFAASFSKVNVGNNGAITLRDGNMDIFARYPVSKNNGAMIGSTTISYELKNILRVGQGTGTYDTITSSDGIARKFSFLKFSIYPLYIFVGQAKDEYMAGWRRQLVDVVALDAVFFLGALMSAWLIYATWMSQKGAEEKLRLSEERFRTIFEESPVGIAMLGKEREIFLTNQCYRDFLGYSAAEIREKGPSGLLHPDDLAPSLELSDKLRSGQCPLFHLEQRYLRNDGRVVWSDTRISALRDHLGQVIYTIGWVQDITARKEADRVLQESEARFRTLIEEAPLAIGTSRGGVNLYANGKYLKMFNFVRPDDIAGRRVANHWAPQWQALIDESAPQRSKPAPPEVVGVARRADGSPFPAEITVTVMDLPDGRATVAFITDLTERKKLEEQLVQSQKMESIGRLAGGVAHDFNNKLTVIMGHALLALTQTVPVKVQENLEEIQKAAEQSADLTRQLLAFARRQTISPKLINLNDCIAAMLKMLQRLIGEDIQLVWVPAPGLWTVRMDPSQVDQILANLCVNARDAIADTGRVTIETQNCVVDSPPGTECEIIPGNYVRLNVQDSGCGMDGETRAHIFEPFFTTKSLGKGTGLGLATVFGIIQQNNCFIDVFSHSGQGSTFSIFIPCQGVAEPVQGTGGRNGLFPGGKERILVVEDEKSVSDLISAILKTQGYTVLVANTPKDAIQLVTETDHKIHLLISDVILPEMNGRDLADRLGQLKVIDSCLFMSGYTADIISHHGVLDEKVNFIQKPFSPADLTLKVRTILAAEKGG